MQCLKQYHFLQSVLSHYVFIVQWALLTEKIMINLILGSHIGTQTWNLGLFSWLGLSEFHSNNPYKCLFFFYSVVYIALKIGVRSISVTSMLWISKIPQHCMYSQNVTVQLPIIYRSKKALLLQSLLISPYSKVALWPWAIQRNLFE